MIRYMGTKRHLAAFVRNGIESVSSSGPVLDLFAGMGSVATLFANERPVRLNDSSEFVTSILRSKFLDREISEPVDEAVVADIFNQLATPYLNQLTEEAEALAHSPLRLSNYISRAKHSGNSSTIRRRAAQVARSAGTEHYQLCALYFSAGYMSLRQAIQADAIRCAIDQHPQPLARDALLSHWMTAISRVLNAPGHSAQFLKPTSQTAFERVGRSWRRDLSREFFSLDSTDLRIGDKLWRASNRVTSLDALTLMRSISTSDATVIYADPPYTRDQYGRFYHLYETLYKYDFPDARGEGRVRSDTFISAFSRKTAVETSMRALLQNAGRARVPVVLSYPANGLLNQTGTSPAKVAKDYFNDVEVRSMESDHSTMGASSGSRRKITQEQLIICTF